LLVDLLESSFFFFFKLESWIQGWNSKNRFTVISWHIEKLSRTSRKRSHCALSSIHSKPSTTILAFNLLKSFDTKHWRYHFGLLSRVQGRNGPANCCLCWRNPMTCNFFTGIFHFS
jgi:hypothetical protein